MRQILHVIFLCAGMLFTGYFAYGQNDLAIIGEVNVCPEEAYSYYVNAEGNPGETNCTAGYFSWVVYGGHFYNYAGSPGYGGTYVIGGTPSVTVVWDSNVRGSLSVDARESQFDPAVCGASMSTSYILPVGTTAPTPQAPSFSGTTNNLCPGDQVTITAAGASSGYDFEYVWEWRTNGGAFAAYAVTDANNFSYTAPAISGTATNTVEFRVMTRMKLCPNLISGWVTSGPLYINPAPPSFGFVGQSAKICDDAGSITINITSDNSATDFFFAYLTSTGEDDNTILHGNGQHTIPIPFTTPTNGSDVTVTYRVRYVNGGAEAPSVCASADATVDLGDASYKLSLTAVPTQERCHNSGDGAVSLTVNNGLAPYS